MLKSIGKRSHTAIKSIYERKNLIQSPTGLNEPSVPFDQPYSKMGGFIVRLSSSVSRWVRDLVCVSGRGEGGWDEGGREELCRIRIPILFTSATANEICFSVHTRCIIWVESIASLYSLPFFTISSFFSGKMQSWLRSGLRWIPSSTSSWGYERTLVHTCICLCHYDANNAF